MLAQMQTELMGIISSECVSDMSLWLRVKSQINVLIFKVVLMIMITPLSMWKKKEKKERKVEALVVFWPEELLFLMVKLKNKEEKNKTAQKL